MGAKKDDRDDLDIAVLYKCKTCVIVPSEGPTVVNKGRKKSCQLSPLLSLPSLLPPATAAATVVAIVAAFVAVAIAATTITCFC